VGILGAVQVGPHLPPTLYSHKKTKIIIIISEIRKSWIWKRFGYLMIQF